METEIKKFEKAKIDIAEYFTDGIELPDIRKGFEFCRERFLDNVKEIFGELPPEEKRYYKILCKVMEVIDVNSEDEAARLIFEVAPVRDIYISLRKVIDIVVFWKSIDKVGIDSASKVLEFANRLEPCTYFVPAFSE